MHTCTHAHVRRCGHVCTSIDVDACVHVYTYAWMHQKHRSIDALKDSWGGRRGMRNIPSARTKSVLNGSTVGQDLLWEQGVARERPGVQNKSGSMRVGMHACRKAKANPCVHVCRHVCMRALWMRARTSAIVHARTHTRTHARTNATHRWSRVDYKSHGSHDA